MTRFLLVRHTAHDYLKKGIAGRLPDVHLNIDGRAAAEHLGDRLSGLPIDAIYSGPLDRVRETAKPLAGNLGLPVQIAPEFDEVEMGQWTGRSFSELRQLPEWQHWNSFRSATKAPGGETMLDVQQRAVGKMMELLNRGRLIAIFSHGDVIRSVLAHFLGVHLDLLFRIDVDPGGMSLVELGQDFARVRFINAVAGGVETINALVRADTTGY